MKILQAFDFLSLPHGGGTVDIVYRLSKALASRGHEVTICTGDYEVDWKYLSGLGDVGLKMYRSYFNRHGIYLTPGLAKLDVKEYDIVHLHCYRSIQNIILAQKARKYGIPYIIDAHGSTVARTGRKTMLLGAYDKLTGRRLICDARYLIAETNVGVDEWLLLGGYERQIKIQHPLLDTSEFDVLPDKGTFRRKHNLGNSTIIMFLGRIHHAKGIDTLLNASRRFLLNRDTLLIVAGQDDGYRNAITHLAQVLNMQERVVFVGYLSGTDKLAALVDADVLVQPSRNEAGARPSLEAIMCHTPVAVSKDTGAGKVIASFEGGLLFRSWDAGELADRIQEIIDNPGEAKARTEKARAYIEANLSLANGIVGYEQLYQEAVS